MRLLPVAISIAVASIVGPRIVERIGTTAVVVGGLAHLRGGAGMGVDRRRRTPYIEIALQMVLLGGGLGLTTAPATESIMGSLSADKAGVGSAVNDTTRELGGTLGVAIVGSVFASIYSSRLSGSTGVGQPARRRLARRWSGRWPPRRESSVQLPQDVVPDVRAAVNTAFLDGLQIGSLVSAGIALRPLSSSPWLLPAPGKQPAPTDRAGRIRGGVRMSTYTDDVDRRPRHHPVLHSLRRIPRCGT